MTDKATPKRHSRKGLYAPFILLLVLLAGWTGWWFFLTRQIETRLEAQAEAMRGRGWTIDYADPSISGWPFRARVALPHASITAPSGHAVAAPELVAEANAYQPTKWVVVAPDGLTLTRAAKGKVNVRGDAVRMSVHGLDQRWPNLALELVNPVFTPHPGAEPFPIARAGRVELYSRPHVAGGVTAADDVDVLFRLIDAQGRPAGPVEGFAQQGRLTLQIETVLEDASRLRASGSDGLFAAWTRAGGRFTQVRGEMSAGQSRATLSSDELRAEADGRIAGQVALKAEQPLRAIAGLARSGEGTVNRLGATGAAAAAGAADATGQGDVQLTLLFRDGRTWLGPFPIAPAPKLF